LEEEGFEVRPRAESSGGSPLMRPMLLLLRPAADVFLRAVIMAEAALRRIDSGLDGGVSG